MRGFFLSLACVAVFATAGFLWLAQSHPEIIDGYQKNARTPLFAAFITLGSFLLTLKTTVLQRLKEGFDSDKHKKNYILLKAAGNRGKYYGSLHNMSVAIAACVFSSLITSAIQMTVGFITHPLAFAFCASSATTTLGLVLYLWREITANHRLWLTKIEDEMQAKLADEDEKTKAAYEKEDAERAAAANATP